MKTILALIAVVFISVSALAQEQRQVGFLLTAGDTTISDRTAGIRADIVLPAGDHVGIYSNVNLFRVPIDTAFGRINGRQFEADGDLRFSPFSRAGFHFFGGVGLNYQRQITDFGSQGYTAPTALAGAGFGKYGHAAYRHGFRDITSPFQQRFEQGEANAYIPMIGSRWNGRVFAQYRRAYQSTLAGPFNYSMITFGLGVSRKLGAE